MPPPLPTPSPSAQLPDAVHVVVPNLGHVVTDSDAIGCTLGIAHRFVKNLAPGDTHCVNKVRPVRTVPLFALTASELAPLESLKGDKTTDAQRRIDAAGKAIIQSDAPPTRVQVIGGDGPTFYEVWNTRETPVLSTAEVVNPLRIS